MKRIITTAFIMAMAMSSFAQLKINESKDEMTDKVSYSPSEVLVCARTNKFGFKIRPNITIKKDNKVVEDLIITMVGLERCNDKNTMIILFEDGEKLTLKSWNKFNCKGTAYFRLGISTIDKLKSTEITKIRLTNGRSYKSYTYEMVYKNYFIELFGLLKINH